MNVNTNFFRLFCNFVLIVYKISKGGDKSDSTNNINYPGMGSAMCFHSVSAEIF